MAHLSDMEELLAKIQAAPISRVGRVQPALYEFLTIYRSS